MNLEQENKEKVMACETVAELDLLADEIAGSETLKAIADDRRLLLIDCEQYVVAKHRVPRAAAIKASLKTDKAVEAAEECMSDADEEDGLDSEAAPAPAPAPASAPATAPVAVVASPASIVSKVRRLDENVAMAAFPHVKYKMNKEGEMEVVGLLSTLENTQHLLDQYGIQCAYNEMTKATDIALPALDLSLDNAGNTAISHIKSLARRCSLPVTEIVEYLSAVADSNKFHPVRDWISAAKWDGVSRIDSLAEALLVEPGLEAHRTAMLRRWLISAVAAVYSEKATDKYELVLVLQGPQGAGKTSFFRSLCDVPNAVKDGMLLDPDNKDSVVQLIGHWLVELGELDGVFRKADIAKLKAFVSKTDDEVRRAYAVKESRYKRRTALCATVNEENYLTDTSGNRRWGTVPVKGVNFKHGVDMQQLWAEVKTFYEAGEQWHLTAEEDSVLSKINGQHQALQPMEELLTEAFVFEQPGSLTLVGVETPAKKRGVKLNATMVVQGLGMHLDKKNTNEMAVLLRKHAGEPSRSGKLGKYWELTPSRASNWAPVAAADVAQQVPPEGDLAWKVKRVAEYKAAKEAAEG
jgi:predicted P-loop ATPase